MDSEGGPAGVCHQFTGGSNEDVGARDDVGALQFEDVLDPQDGVKAIPREGEVDGVVALGLVVGIGGDEDGSVAAAHHAVAEEEAEGGSGGGGGVMLLFVNDSSDGIEEGGTGFFVVIGSEFVLHGREE